MDGTNRESPPQELPTPKVEHLAPAPTDTAPTEPPAVSNEAEGMYDRRYTPGDSGTDRRRTSRAPKVHLFLFLSHWGIVTLLTLSLLSGMRIGWGYLESPLGGPEGWWSALLNAIAPTGTLWGINLITLHVLLAFCMIGLVSVYVIYMVRSRASRRLHVTRKDLQNLTEGVKAPGFWHNKKALWTSNVLVYWIAFLFIGVLLVSGIALYRLNWGLTSVLGGYSTVRLVHSIIAYLLVPYTVLHIVLQWFFGRFWTIFKAQLYRPHVLAGLLGVAIAVPVALGLFAGNEVAETLTATRLTADMPAPVLDGKPTDPAWDQVEAVTLRTVKGMNNPHDYVDLHVKALHDGTQIYFQFQWDDPDVSGKRFPLLKTPDGWKVLQTALEYADENVYYEDKLSVYFTDVTNGSCATTCHVGSGPHAERGEKHGLHYTAGEVGDVWHWKYVRTNFMHHEAPGYMDDQHFKAPEPLPTEITTRYSGGYHPDPKTGGGYTYNFVKLDPAKPLAETYVQPKMLPPTRNIRPHVDPATSDQEATWWIHQSEGIPYTAEADTYPVGTLIPNILIAPFEGDRADVRAKGAWHNGRWTLEARRALDTGSAYDVAFTTDRPIYLSIAAYNRTQTRHSEHIKPIKLVLEK